MSISEYLEKHNISLRELARRLEISQTYLADLRDGKRKTISENLAYKFKEIAPEITIIKEVKSIYKVEGDK